MIRLETVSVPAEVPPLTLTEAPLLRVTAPAVPVPLTEPEAVTAPTVPDTFSVVPAAEMIAPEKVDPVVTTRAPPFRAVVPEKFAVEAVVVPVPL